MAASNGIAAGDIRGWIDTGVYILNGQLSGSLYGGIPDNKIVVFAGLEGVGKTYFVLSLVKHFLDTHPTGGVMFFESESAISRQMLEDRGIDTKRVIVVPVSTIQEWRTQALKILAKYKSVSEDKRQPMIYCLDSLGMLSTTKEMEDSESGSEKTDMTRARLIKATFRTLTLKLGVLGVPFIITNHTYETQGLFAKKVQSGGSGVRYANSMTVMLGKSKEKEGDEVVGALIRSKLDKGRITKEQTVVTIKLYFDRGLDKYYGLLDLAEKYGIAEKVKAKKEKDGKEPKVAGFLIGGQQATEKTIYAHPEKYFTGEVMADLEIAAGKEFKYGIFVDIPEDEDPGVEVDVTEATTD
jgi:RecA/RadA recombinase